MRYSALGDVAINFKGSSYDWHVDPAEMIEELSKWIEIRVQSYTQSKLICQRDK